MKVCGNILNKSDSCKHIGDINNKSEEKTWHTDMDLYQMQGGPNKVNIINYSQLSTQEYLIC